MEDSFTPVIDAVRDLGPEVCFVIEYTTLYTVQRTPFFIMEITLSTANKFS